MYTPTQMIHAYNYWRMNNIKKNENFFKTKLKIDELFIFAMNIYFENNYFICLHMLFLIQI